MKVRSEIDIVFEIAKRENWEDCEVFGSGDMITQPQEAMGWKLIPADLFKYSIPAEAVARLHQIINAGIRVRGVIIADDERRQEPAPAPARPKVSLSAIRKASRSAMNTGWSALVIILSCLKTVVSSISNVLFGLIRMAVVITLICLGGYALIHFWPVALIGLFIFGLTSGGTRVKYDPKLVILVEDGKGGTVWISLFTWYD